MHIQDNPGATCAMKIRPLCEGNVIVCVPRADCSVKVASKVLKICSFVQGFIDSVTEKKVTWHLGYSPQQISFCGFYTHIYIFYSSSAMFRDNIIFSEGPSLLAGRILSVFYRDQEPQLNALQAECHCQRKCKSQGTMNIP